MTGRPAPPPAIDEFTSRYLVVDIERASRLGGLMALVDCGLKSKGQRNKLGFRWTLDEWHRGGPMPIPHRHFGRLRSDRVGFRVDHSKKVALQRASDLREDCCGLPAAPDPAGVLCGHPLVPLADDPHERGHADADRPLAPPGYRASAFPRRCELDRRRVGGHRAPFLRNGPRDRHADDLHESGRSCASVGAAAARRARLGDSAAPPARRSPCHRRARLGSIPRGCSQSGPFETLSRAARPSMQ